MVGLYCQ